MSIKAPLLTFGQAQQILQQNLQQQLDSMLHKAPAVEALAIGAALGRICACDMYSDLDIPLFTNSAMDGYALRYSDLAGLAAKPSLPIAATLLAGCNGQVDVPVGACVRIMTGAKIPAGLDTVVMQEDTQADNGRLTLISRVTAGSHIRVQGSEIAKGAKVIAQGEVLGPLQLGLLATLGIANVQVYRPLRVAVLSTGDELVAPGSPLADGKIYDSNRFVLSAMLSRLQCQVIDYGWVADDRTAIKALFDQASAECDVVITSGGVSVGDADFTTQILAGQGEVQFWKVAMKPGKPFACGKYGKAWFFGLPGNPVSAVVTLDLLVQPVLCRLAGQNPQPRVKLNATAAEAIRKSPGRMDFQRGWYWQDALGLLQVKTAGNQSSGMISSMIAANCYIALELERGQVSVGEQVEIWPFSAILQ